MRRPIVADTWDLGWVPPGSAFHRCPFLAVSCLVPLLRRVGEALPFQLNECYLETHGAPQGQIAHTKRGQAVILGFPQKEYLYIYYYYYYYDGWRWRCEDEVVIVRLVGVFYYCASKGP